MIKIANFKYNMKIKCPVCDWKGAPESNNNVNTDSLLLGC